MEKLSYLKINGEEYEIGGDSAYEIAVKNGFVGTEKEWLNSLKGNTDNHTKALIFGAFDGAVNLNGFCDGRLCGSAVDGVPSQTGAFRVCTGDEKLIFDYPIKLTLTREGKRFALNLFDVDDNFIKSTEWQKGTYCLPANTPFILVVSNQSEWTADEEFNIFTEDAVQEFLSWIVVEKYSNESFTTVDIHDMKNGSLPNTGNINAVSFTNYEEIKDSKFIVRYNIDLNGGYTLWSVWVHKGYGENADPYYTPEYTVVHNELRVEKNHLYLDLTEYVKQGYTGFAVGVFVVDANGNLISQRINGNAKQIEVIYYPDRQEFAEFLGINDKDNIVARNADILHRVYASSMYGVHGNGQSNYKKKYSLLVTTDVHDWKQQFNNAIEYLNAIPSIDAGCCLGDIVASNVTENTEWYNNAVARATKPFYTVLGNHDCGNSAEGNLALDTEEVISKFITPNESAMGMSGLTTPYYTFAVEDHKLTFIALCDFDSPSNKDDDGNYLVYRGLNCYSQAQIDWFIDTLLNIPEDHSLVIMRHSYYEPNTRFECNFSQDNAILVGNGLVYGEVDIIPFIVDAWMKGTACNKTFAPLSDYTSVCGDLNVTADFSSRGNGQFICYLSGHTHKDVIAYSTTYPDQIVIGFVPTAGGLYQNANNDLQRVDGTKSEDAITVVSFDTDNKCINLVRVGSNITTDMRDRTMYSIPYNDKSYNIGGYSVKELANILFDNTEQAEDLSV